MINFVENSTKVKGLTSDGISPDREKVKIKLVLKDGKKKLLFILINIFYFPNSLSNLVSLSLLNDAKIYHHNKDQILYNLEIQKILIFLEQFKISFFLYPINLSVAIVNLFKNSKFYKKKNDKYKLDKRQKAFSYLLASTSWLSKLYYLKKIPRSS